MSELITGELRRAMRIGYAVEDGEQVDAIRHGAFMDQCAAIDSIHDNLERENESLRRELDRVLGELDDVHKTDGISDNSGGFMQNAEHHAWAPESHYMMLPKDADGEPIHIGDVMEWVRYGDDDKTIVREVSGVGVEVFFAWSDEQGRYAQYEAHAYRHHHADSWERIIKDAHDAGAHGKVFDLSEAVARCKALAGDAQ